MPRGLAPQMMAWQRLTRGLPGPVGASGAASTGDPVTVEMLINGVWTDITSYVMVRDDSGQITITRGIRDEGAQTEQANATLPLKNQDGRFSPRNATGAWYGLIGRNQPIRISVPDGLGGKSYRLWGEVPKWPVSWDTTGTDVWVDVAANGILQRLSQGPAPAHSVIYNAITNPLSSSVVAYWPMEDASGSTSLASALTTGSPMTWTGTPTLASYEGFAASDPLPDITSATLSGGVGAYADPTATQVRFLAYIPAAGLADGKVICSIDQVDYSAGSPQFWELYYSTTDANNSLVLHTCGSDGTVLGAILPHTLDVRGRLLYISIELQESGTAATRAVRLKDVKTGRVYSVNDTENLTSLTRVTRVQFGPASRAVSGPAGTQYLPGVAVGHCTVETAITDIGALGIRLNPIGETAGRRIQRLCGEQGVAFDWIGNLDDTVAMGAQGKTNLVLLAQECVTADSGLLYESQAALGLGYRTRASLYDQDPQLILNYTGYNLSAVPTPVEDDRYLANKVTVSVNGVTGTYEDTTSSLSTAPPPAGVGTYGPNADSALALNLATSDTPTLLDQAAWRVHLGTVDEARFPQISVNLAHPSITPDMRRAILGLRIGDRMQVINPPGFLGADSIDQLILGFEETISHFEHRLAFVCAPSSPYNTIGYLDTSARIDTDGSQLAAALDATSTALTVAVTAGPIWVTSGQLNTNRGFETDLNNWTASGATIARVATPGTPPFAGQWSMQITPDGVSQFPNAGSEQIPVTAGVQYVLSGWLLCAVSRNVDLNVNWFDGTHAYLSTTSNDQQVTANTWTFFQQTVTPPAAAVYANLSPTVPSFPPSSNVLYADEIVFRLASDTTNDQFPFPVRVGGEVMQVGTITPSVNDTFTRTVSSSWGTADTGQAWTIAQGVATDFSTNGAQGQHSVSAVNVSRYGTLPPLATADVDLRVDVATSVLAVGGPQYAHVVARYQDLGNLYNARVGFQTDQTLQLTIQKRVGGVQTDMTTVTIAGTHAANAFFTLRFQVTGSTLKAKCWPQGGAEPDWQATATDSSLTQAGSVGVRSVLSSLNTNTLPMTYSYDNFAVLNPQQFTAIRSVNGVVKAHAAGEDLRLAYPTYLAL